MPDTAFSYIMIYECLILIFMIAYFANFSDIEDIRDNSKELYDEDDDEVYVYV